jgi:hypothetical protein
MSILIVRDLRSKKEIEPRVEKLRPSDLCCQASETSNPLGYSIGLVQLQLTVMFLI